MRNLKWLSGIIVCFLLSTAFTNFSTTYFQDAKPIEPAVYKIMEVTYLWDLLSTNYEPDRERDDTWLDVGLRSKYAKAKKYASLAMVEKVFGEKIFVKGPHDTDLNFNSPTEFGHYNKAFLTNLKEATDAALQTPLFKRVAYRVYKKYMRDMAQTYYEAFLYLEQNPEIRERIKREYLAMLDKPGGTTEGSLQEKFRGWAEEQESGILKADVYEAFTAPSFWIRRYIDGTQEDFIQLMDVVMGNLEGAKAKPTYATPTDQCVTSPVLQYNQVYTIQNFNLNELTSGPAIDGMSRYGQEVKGMWLTFEIPQISPPGSKYELRLSNLSDDFNPVLAMKGHCYSNAYISPINENPSFEKAKNAGSYGEDEVFETFLNVDPDSQPGSNNDRFFHVRIYNYSGGERPAVNFEIELKAVKE